MLNSFETLNELPLNLENLILITDIKSTKLQSKILHFPTVCLNNLPMMLKRIIFYSSILNKELEKHIKENLHNIKIPFGCKLYVDNVQILES